MANRDYKNIKRFVDDLSKEVEETMETGGAGGMSQITVYAYNQGYPASFTMFVDTKGLNTYADLVGYLEDKGESLGLSRYPVSF